MDRGRGGRSKGRGRQNFDLCDEMSQMDLKTVVLRGGVRARQRLARRVRRERGRGPEGQNPASSTKDLTHLTFQCNDCSGENSHDSDCDQRLVPCPFAYPNHACRERFTFMNLLRDFEMKHGQVGVMKNGATKKNSNNFPVKIEAFGRVFITTSMTRKGVYYQWVKLVGSASEAKDFVFSLEYEGFKTTHTFMGEVASIDDTTEEVISSDKCSSIECLLFDVQFSAWSITIKRRTNDYAF